MIKILDANLNRLGVIRNVIDCTRREEINGENILDFNAVLDAKLNELINEDTIFELDDDYFDAAVIEKNANEDGTYTVNVECDHVSYRLNNPIYNEEFFTEMGTPSYILGKVLNGTGFNIGTVSFNNVIVYSAQEAKSRRQLLMELVAYLKGEIRLRKFDVDILIRRGSSEAKPAIKDRSVKVINKTINKRELDESGAPLVSYKCTPIYLPDDIYSLGDDIRLMNKDLNINEDLRVVSISINPYNKMTSIFEFANYVNGLESHLYRIATSSVIKDKLYNGTRIGPEFGFEAVRNDKLARAYFRSDGMALQSGDGEGHWRDRLYYEYDSVMDESVLIFDGELSADIINGITAIITPNLYADRAMIADLTVDSLETSTKIKNFLNGDKSDVNYIKIYDQTIQFITASVSYDFSSRLIQSGVWDMAVNRRFDTYFTSINIDQTTGRIILTGGTPTAVSAEWAFNRGFIYRRKDIDTYYKLTANTGVPAQVSYSEYDVVPGGVNSEHINNKKGELLYWVDVNKEVASAKVTAFPVMQYVYNVSVKQSISFELDPETGAHVPVTIYGAGTGTTAISGQVRQIKHTTGMNIVYNTSNGQKFGGVYWRDDGFVDVTSRRAHVKVQRNESRIVIRPEGDDQTDILIDYVETGNKLVLTWPDGQVFNVEVE